ncbi:MAG: SiaB family protein kinase [Bacteroidales bacterium]|nr:SiaB family protein kinase [Bacteroidales bacterium]
MSELIHNNTLDIFNTMFENFVVASYVGPIDSDILTLLGENIELTLWESETQRRRFFKIFIELAHNIALYSEERCIISGKEYGEGTFIINDYGDYFLFSAGNVVSDVAKKDLWERCEEINNLDRIELRALKRIKRKKGNQKGGGNIGLIQVALLSKNPIEVKFFPTEESNKSFYLVSVRLEKG